MKKLKQDRSAAKGQSVASAWRLVKQRFNLKATPGKSSISRTLKLSSELLSKRVVVDKVTRQRRGMARRLEKALYAWVNYQINLDRNLNGSLIVKQASRLQNLANENLPAANCISLKFSDGWMSNFKRRWGLNRLSRSEGKGEKRVPLSSAANLAGIQEKLKTYPLRNIFIAVEWGLFYDLTNLS